MMDLIQRLAAERAADQKRFDAIGEIARRQGLVIVEMSPRRSIVVKIDESSGRGYYSVGEQRSHRAGFYTNLSGKVVFGPSTHAACRLYVAGSVEPLPAELTTRYGQ